MAELGLNVYQVIQNELLAREGNRSTLGLGFRLAILEIKLNNAEATSRNGRVWKLHHAVTPIKALTPQAKRAAKAEERRLLGLKGGDKHKDPKDPTKLIRDEEVWEICDGFPRTVLEFKELQFSPERIRDLMDFYDVPAYRPDRRLVDVHPDDGLRDIGMNTETCMEELAMTFGLNWHRIDGMALPQGVASSIGSPQSGYGMARHNTTYSI